ncbi:NAD(P)/FAD-dependent oxidoreductase [Microbacterium sp. Sa4CUA7]|uniref:NAD(P)/FAD-dependent oxidoreductase n=1 Tax=Microbacterium pullorum TaxID=2762236 RepID=A0ABR8S3Q4_9MICO|nr:NAD(P)/FAD-dependent oxidoreductase [Microbacterium pullorum]MBD7958117.1 NAD(P)/FAD-dependent oxidoreductase [Microbacterium pullorum]
MPRIGIIGSGFGAIAVATEFLQHGYGDVRLWEKADSLGGVWRDNVYPGAACDVPSPFYSFSFAPWPSWPRRYAEQPAILRYLRAVAEREGVTARTRFGAGVVAAAWNGACWLVTLEDGTTDEVDLLVSAVGQLSTPTVPSLPGAESFAGPAFHTARWPQDLDVRGLRVAVIGAAATAVQAVPALAPVAERVILFQRTPSYIWPKPDAVYPRWYRRIAAVIERPFFRGLGELFSRQLDPDSIAARIGAAVTRAHLRLRVRDPALRRALTPDYPIGCRRILFSNNFYPALCRDDVDLVTAGIQRIEPGAVVTADGRSHPADVLVCATGFDAQSFLRGIRITGPGGKDLHEHWSAGARAHLGIYVPGFPNLLLSYGPNTNLGGSSIIRMLEAEARHMRLAVDRMVSSGARTLEATPAAEQAWDDEVQTRLAGTAWVSCDSWYRHPVTGRITSNWPGGTNRYVARVRDLVEDEFVWR